MPLAAALLLAILLTQAYIDLELALDLGPWHMNAPAADLFALALVPVALLLRRRAPLPPPLPGAWGYALFLAASAISVTNAIDPAAAAHHLLRKPIFLYVAYGFALPLAVALAPGRLVGAGLLAGAGLTAMVSLASSAARIAAGDALWFQALSGLTPNHKTLAVALSAQVPLLLAVPWIWPAPSPRARQAALAVLGLALVSILASASKTAWITAAFALAWFLPTSRPLATRPKIVAPLLAISVGLALYAPLLVGSKAMLDAARSRHSLNVRAWEMFTRHPLFGSGTGMNVREEMVTFPHYRVNGVDAHGVIQKIASETGLVGLLGYAAFVGLTGAALLRLARAQGRESLAYAVLACFAALHLNLLLSTEAFSPTHWVPFGLAWGLAWRSVYR